MVNDHSDNKRWNMLPSFDGLLFLITRNILLFKLLLLKIDQQLVFNISELNSNL